MGVLEIRTGAATDDAKQIERIVSTIKDSMEILEREIKKYIPSDIQTAWSEKLREDWEQYYKSEIPASMADMLLSAQNLELAVQNALKHSNEI